MRWSCVTSPRRVSWNVVVWECWFWSVDLAAVKGISSRLVEEHAVRKPRIRHSFTLLRYFKLYKRAECESRLSWIFYVCENDLTIFARNFCQNLSSKRRIVSQSFCPQQYAARNLIDVNIRRIANGITFPKSCRRFCREIVKRFPSFRRVFDARILNALRNVLRWL